MRKLKKSQNANIVKEKVIWKIIVLISILVTIQARRITPQRDVENKTNQWDWRLIIHGLILVSGFQQYNDWICFSAKLNLTWRQILHPIVKIWYIGAPEGVSTTMKLSYILRAGVKNKCIWLWPLLLVDKGGIDDEIEIELMMIVFRMKILTTTQFSKGNKNLLVDKWLGHWLRVQLWVFLFT